MSSFKFSSLPEDVRILVAQEVVKEYRIERDDNRKMRKAKEERLEELSI